MTDDTAEDWIEQFRLTPEMQEKLVAAKALVPAKIRKRREHFVMLPMTWYERLKGAHGQTYRVAWYLLYLHWKSKGSPIKLANGMLAMDGVPATSKRRALGDLERRGLITVERQFRKSPVVRLVLK
jgi:hypothetical protein